jgi:hypothetical protein
MHFCKSKNVNCTVTKNNRGYFLRNKIIDPNTVKKKRNFGEELTQKRSQKKINRGYFLRNKIIHPNTLKKKKLWRRIYPKTESKKDKLLSTTA